MNQQLSALLCLVPISLTLLAAGCAKETATGDADDESEPAMADNDTVPQVPKPDFTAAAADPKYAQVIAEVERLLGAKRQPLEAVEGPVTGGFSFDVPRARIEALLPKAHTNYLAKGVYLFRYDQSFDIGGQPDKVGLLPTTNKFDVIAAMETDGANSGLYTAGIIQWLKQLEPDQPFVLTGVGFDYLEGYFTTPVKDPKALAKRMYKFCPDIVDQGVGTVDALAKELQKGKLYFWWD
ncbi:MAG TPA: DUF4253 domain-containing protein [Clostridia bacterium]|nr:DUF4253 domain-containing protein [Clostridia bacterium]